MARRTYVACPCSPTVSFTQRIGSALFYAICSSLAIVVNKVILTTYEYMAATCQSNITSLFHNRFPSYQLLAIGQVGNDRKPRLFRDSILHAF